MYQCQDTEMAELVSRIRGEYREMPGLMLTERQMCRLLAIDADTCDAIVHVLTAEHFLSRTAQGAYVRAGDGA